MRDGDEGVEIQFRDKITVKEIPAVLLKYGHKYRCYEPTLLCEVAAGLIHEWRSNLRQIARAAACNAEGVALSKLPTLTLFDSSILTLDESGRAQVARSEFFDAIHRVDATRIRECWKCNRIFWAGRKDQLCCSTGCAHALRNRQYRVRVNEREKRILVLDACKKDFLTEEEVSQTTGIALDDIKRVVEKLTDLGTIEWTALRSEQPKFRAIHKSTKIKKGS